MQTKGNVMKKTLLASAAILVLATTSTFAAEKEFPAKLVSQAVLPANTIIAAPADAPEHLKTSGKFTTADRKRAEGLGTVAGKDGVRKTGLSMPFAGQAMQGFSGIKTMSDGTFWSLSDNGFGSKSNSSDSMLMLHHLKIDWANGKVEPQKPCSCPTRTRRHPSPPSWKVPRSVI